VEVDATPIFCRFRGGDELPAPSPSLARFLFLTMVWEKWLQKSNHRDPTKSKVNRKALPCSLFSD
jgi:hypothetical protein